MGGPAILPRPLAEVRRIGRLGLIVAALLQAGAAGASRLEPAAVPLQAQSGKVVRVTDGDSLWWKPDAGGRAIRVRLKGIDAPEICQAFGAESRDALAALVRGQPVRLERLGVDDHGRVLGRLRTPAVPDVAAQLVEQGQAWSYRFQGDPGPYKALEDRAVASRRGLHQTGDAVQPRAFRQSHGSCH